jgi:hypothetical protein
MRDWKMSWFHHMILTEQQGFSIFGMMTGRIYFLFSGVDDQLPMREPQPQNGHHEES